MPLKKTNYKSFVFILILSFFISAVPVKASAENFAVTSPWVKEIVEFISKGRITVRGLSKWDNSGGVVIYSYPKSNEIVIALNANDAKKFRIKSNNKKLRTVYSSSERMDDEKNRIAFYDPSVLPFVAQKVMKIIAASDKKGYPFYQRRLAEFQSRINSVVDIGRHLIGDIKILDLTKTEGVWISASSKNIMKPPSEVWNSWLHGNTVSLTEVLKETKRRKWIVVVDSWTPYIIRKTAMEYNHCVFLSPPQNDSDYFAYLHELLISIWNKDRELYKTET